MQVDAAPIELDETAIVDDDIVKLPSDDVYLEGWNMSVTIDFALKGDLEPEQLELELIQNGSQIEVLKSSQPKPIARIELPHPCDDVIDWTLNNGILDITLKLTPKVQPWMTKNMMMIFHPLLTLRLIFRMTTMMMTVVFQYFRM